MRTYITNDLCIRNMMENYNPDDQIKIYQSIIHRLEERLEKAMEWEDVKISLPVPIEGIDFVDCIVATETIKEVFCACYTITNGIPEFYDYDRRGDITKYVTHWIKIKKPFPPHPLDIIY